MKHFSFKREAIAYAIRILLGSVIVWWSLYYLHDDKKVWALISIIVVSDPDFSTVRKTIVARTINTVTGGALGILFILLFGINVWSLFAAITVAVIISTSFKNYPASWKLAPVTVVIVMAPSIMEGNAWREAMTIALTRTGEVLYGCLVAYLLGIFFIFIDQLYKSHSGSA
jgi:uncharacterized membrane protein YccC